MDSNGHNSGIATLLDLTNGRKYPISKTKEMSLGRSFECNVLIKDAYASRVHCFIFYEDGKFNIYDNCTRSGTFVNCDKILPGKPNALQLKHADCISFGEKTKLIHIFKFCLTDCEQPGSNTLMSDAKELRIVLTESLEKVKILKKGIALLRYIMTIERNQYDKMFDILSDLVLHIPTLGRSTEGPIHQRLFNEIVTFLNTSFTCYLCNQIIIEAVTIQCSHIFCNYCLTTNLGKINRCPIPGCGVSIQMIIRLRSIDNIVMTIIEELGETKIRQRENDLARRARRKPVRSNFYQHNDRLFETIYSSESTELQYTLQSALDANILTDDDYILTRLLNSDQMAYQELLQVQLSSQAFNRDQDEVVDLTGD